VSSKSGGLEGVRIGRLDQPTVDANFRILRDILGGMTPVWSFSAQATTPADPAAGGLNVYFKGSLLVAQYNDSGTVRYKYLDLAGTGVTWTHTTTAP
jgi:hypothetical protein